MALALWLGFPVTPLLTEEVDRVTRRSVYEREVFLVRPLGFVIPTGARRISYADSLRFERLHEEVYRDHGYVLVDVPPGPVSERAHLVEETMR